MIDKARDPEDRLRTWLDRLEASIPPDQTHPQLPDDRLRWLDRLELDLGKWPVESAATLPENPEARQDDARLPDDPESRREAAFRSDDPARLNRLAFDADFHIRTLALCNPATSPAVLDRAADQAASEPYLLMILAHNPSVRESTLEKIARLGKDEPEILKAVLDHRNCSRLLKRKLSS